MENDFIHKIKPLLWQILFLGISTVLFSLILANRSPNLLRPISMSLRTGFGLVIPHAALILYLAFRVPNRLGDLASMAAALSLFAMPLARLWAGRLLRENKWISWKALFVSASAVVLGFALNLGLTRLAAVPSGVPFANFSYTRISPADKVFDKSVLPASTSMLVYVLVHQINSQAANSPGCPMRGGTDAHRGQVR